MKTDERPRGVLTVEQAAARMGLSKGAVRKALHVGALRGQLDEGFDRRGVPCTRWHVDETAVEVYLRARRRHCRRWTADMDAAILELAQTCTVAQTAAYVGISEDSVHGRLRTLKRRGEYSGSLLAGKAASAFTVPGGAILLAKSCTQCGHVRDVRFYGVSRHRYRDQCNLCRAAENKSRRAAKDTAEALKLLQAISLDTATRRGTEWTAAEDAAVLNRSKSMFEVAVELGRSLYAVQTRHKRIAESGPRNPALGDWRIDFGATAVEQDAIAEYFRRLGGVVPESLWDWTDNDDRSNAA